MFSYLGFRKKLQCNLLDYLLSNNLPPTSSRFPHFMIQLFLLFFSLCMLYIIMNGTRVDHRFTWHPHFMALLKQQQILQIKFRFSDLTRDVASYVWPYFMSHSYFKILYDLYNIVLFLSLSDNLRTTFFSLALLLLFIPHPTIDCYFTHFFLKFRRPKSGVAKYSNNCTTTAQQTFAVRKNCLSNSKIEIKCNPKKHKIILRMYYICRKYTQSFVNYFPLNFAV